jgi:cell division protein FtsI/penicillin-binding protein 2
VLTALLATDDDLTAPVRCLTDLPLAAVMALAQAGANPYSAADWRGAKLESGFGRTYPYGKLFGHITGYVNTLSPQEYRQLRGYWDENGDAVAGGGVVNSRGAEDGILFAVAPESEEAEIIALREIVRSGQTLKTWGDLRNPTVGRGGIEQWYNQRLRGRHQWTLETLNKTPGGWRTFIHAGAPPEPQNGAEIKLTLDAEFQAQVRDITRDELATLARQSEHRATLARHQLTEFPAAVVVMNARNGELLALVSLPEYDPNELRQNYAALTSEPAQPLLNRAVSENFPPGSSLKPLVATAALLSGKMSAQTHFDCQGVELLGNRKFVCMNNAHHGNLDVTAALRVSCNIFFYHAGGLLGSRPPDSLAGRLTEFGIGQATGIDLPREAAGYLAPAALTGRNWSLGETWHIAIGQGQIDATPLQIAVAYAMLVNGGAKVRPHLRYEPSDEKLAAPIARRQLPPEIIAPVRRGLWEVVQGNAYPRGTAYKKGHIAGFEYLGKTGSAQGKKPDTHAWFCAAAPAAEPEIIVCVLVPFGNHGGDTCAPIVKRIIETYFHLAEFPREDENVDEAGDYQYEDEFTGEAEAGLG